MFNKTSLLLPLGSLLLSVSAANAAVSLGVGDITILGFSSDSVDQFSFVTWVELDATTTIQFTDRGWRNTAGRFTQNPSEEPGSALTGRADGTLAWTSNETIPAGTIITATVVDGGGTNPDTATWTKGSSSGDFGTTGLGSLSGESIFAFQGLDTNPTFIFGLKYGSDNWISTDPGQYSTNPSNLPAVLNTSTGSLFVQADNGYYSGSMSDLTTIADYRARVLNTSNWTTSNDDIPNLGSSFASSTFTTVPEPSTSIAALGGAALLLYRRRRK